MFNIFRRVNFKNYSKLNAMNTMNSRNTITNIRLFTEMKHIRNSTWIQHNKDYIKLGITNNFKTVSDTGNILDVIFTVKKGDYILKNDIIAYCIGVNYTKKLEAPFNCCILDLNNDIKTLESLLSLNQDAECEKNNWIVKLNNM